MPGSRWAQYDGEDVGRLPGNGARTGRSARERTSETPRRPFSTGRNDGKAAKKPVVVRLLTNETREI
jgi:hypothetical protein